MNINQFGSILEKGWPKKIDSKIPYCASLFKLQSLYLHPKKRKSLVWEHVKKVLTNMNFLLSKPEKMFKNSHSAESFEVKVKINRVIYDVLLKSHIVDNQDESSLKNFLRIAAFYHDIGKVIQLDRHPTVGYYYMTIIEQAEAEKLRKILGDGAFRILCEMIRFHDLFGVISTGEASALVLLDALPFRSTDVLEQQALLGLLLLLNLADIGGTVDNYPPSKALLLIEDWERLAKLIEDTKGDRQEFTRQLMFQEQNPKNAIGRIQRLLLVRAPSLNYSNAFSSSVELEQLLRIILGPSFNEFCSNFALICKFDYALRFIDNIGQYASSKNKRPAEVIEVIAALLVRIEQCYSSLTRRHDGSRRRIGIQVGGWTRTPEFSNKLITLLFSDLLKGIGWASEEPTAWYLD